MSGPALVSMADAMRGLRSLKLMSSTVTSTPACLPNSAPSRLSSTSAAGTKLTHSRRWSLVPLGKLGGCCARRIPGIPPTVAAPATAPVIVRNARRFMLLPLSRVCMSFLLAWRWTGSHPPTARRTPGWSSGAGSEPGPRGWAMRTPSVLNCQLNCLPRRGGRGEGERRARRMPLVPARDSPGDLERAWHPALLRAGGGRGVARRRGRAPPGGRSPGPEGVGEGRCPPRARCGPAPSARDVPATRGSDSG